MHVMDLIFILQNSIPQSPDSYDDMIQIEPIILSRMNLFLNCILAVVYLWPKFHSCICVLVISLSYILRATLTHMDKNTFG